MCPLRLVPAVLPVETVAEENDTAGADNVFDANSISLRWYRRRSPYVVINTTVSSCRTYVSLRGGRILSSRVIVTALLSLKMRP